MTITPGWLPAPVMERYPAARSISMIFLTNVVQVRTQEEIDHNEILDFEMISFEGHKPQWRPGQSGGPEKVKCLSLCTLFCKQRLKIILQAETQSPEVKVDSSGFLMRMY